MNNPESQEASSLQEKFSQEKDQLPWVELTPFFAQGKTISVDPALDLIEVAIQMSHDNKVLMESWMEKKQVGLVSDEQAKEWFDNKSIVSVLILQPWVLVQQFEPKL